MTWSGIRRGVAIGTACMAVALALVTPIRAGASTRSAAATAPAELSAHSASTSTPNASGELAATAKCVAGEHVVSGGFTSTNPPALVAFYDDGGSWYVGGYAVGKLTTYAYCAPSGQVVINEQSNTGVMASPAPANTTLTASCTSGYTLFSGGFLFYGNASSEANSSTYRNDSPSAGKWTVMAAFSSTPAHLGSEAYCGQGLTVSTHTASKAIAARAAASATASCPTGETLLSGGFTTTPTPDWDKSGGPDTYFSASYRSAERSWTVTAHNYSSVAGTITASAICAS